MRLRCIRGGLGSPFKKGKIYDVAEIMEISGHCMIRKPNGQWARPNDRRWFCWHPQDWFACPRNGLEILSCGYRHEEVECYGVVIPFSRYRRVPKFEAKLERVLDQVHASQPHYVSYQVYRRVQTKCCLPKDLERSFYVISADYSSLGRDISYKAATRIIRRVLSELGMSDLGRQIDDLYLNFFKKAYRDPGRLIWPRQVWHSEV